MIQAKILHNPRCSKSREALDILKSMCLNLEVIEYLKTPPSAADFEEILDHLENPALSLIRQKDDAWKDLAEKPTAKEMIAEFLAKNPSAMERPIVITGQKALVARPPQTLHKWIESI